MATGHSTMLTKQIGEYLVACELARRGFIVATFSGNVPDFDIIATNSNGLSCPIQVKTSRSGSWQFSVDKFAHINFEGQKQIIGERKPLTIPNLLCVFVIAGTAYGMDAFFVLEWAKIQDIALANYAHWLNMHGGVRPKKIRLSARHHQQTRFASLSG